MTANAYSFLPWLRTGLTTKITERTTRESGPRPRIPVTLRLAGEGPEHTAPERTVTQSVQLYGPGDVVGVDPRAISRTEPQAAVTDAEPNYLAHIEFYEEEFLWRYSPAVPDDANRLRPWLALIVLMRRPGPAEHGRGGEFREGRLPRARCRTSSSTTYGGCRWPGNSAPGRTSTSTAISRAAGACSPRSWTHLWRRSGTCCGPAPTTPAHG